MQMSRDVETQVAVSLTVKKNKARRWAIGAGALLALVLSVAAWSYFSPWFELARIQRAVASNDEAMLSESVDKASIREKLVVRLATQALRSAGLSPGDERVSQVVLAVEASVDELLKPENVAKLMDQTKGAGGGMRVEGGYLNVGIFVFAIENKATRGALSLRMRRMGPFSWVLDEVIFLTPQQLGAAPIQGP